MSFRNVMVSLDERHHVITTGPSPLSPTGLEKRLNLYYFFLFFMVQLPYIYPSISC